MVHRNAKKKKKKKEAVTTNVSDSKFVSISTIILGVLATVFLFSSSLALFARLKMKVLWFFAPVGTTHTASYGRRP